MLNASSEPLLNDGTFIPAQVVASEKSTLIAPGTVGFVNQTRPNSAFPNQTDLLVEWCDGVANPLWICYESWMEAGYLRKDTPTAPFGRFDFTCRNCGLDTHRWEDTNGFCDDACASEFLEDKQLKPNFVIAAYECQQRYGGSAEGGWWYDSGTLIRVVRTMRKRAEAYRYNRRFNFRLQSRQFGPNQGRREYTSVLSNGEVRTQVHENHAPKYFPVTKPHYE